MSQSSKGEHFVDDAPKVTPQFLAVSLVGICMESAGMIFLV